MIGWGRAIGVVAVAAVAAIAIVTAPAPAHAVVNTELEKLWTMTPKQAQAYLQKHPETAVDLLNSDSSYVDELWNTATLQQRRTALRSAPELVGNLEGHAPA